MTKKQLILINDLLSQIAPMIAPLGSERISNRMRIIDEIIVKELAKVRKEEKKIKGD